MTEDIGTGSIKLTGDATGFTASMAEARKAAKSLGDDLGNSTQAGAAKAKASVEAYLAKLQQTANNAGKTASEIRLLDLAQRGATESQLAQAAAAFKTIEAAKQQAAEARRMAAATAAAAAAEAARARSSAALASQTKLTAFQTQQLGFQLQDFFVQVQAGQSPLTALIQQGSQLSGTFGGAKGAISAVLTVFTPLRVAVGGVAAVLATLGLSAYQGAEQTRALERSLSLTGNAAGITQGQFERLARGIAQSTNTTVGSARDTLQQLVASGRLSGEALTATAASVQLVAKATGQATSEVLKDFLSLADNVGKGAEDLNRKYNFLTAEQLRYVKTLEDQGERQKAVAVTMAALNGHVDTAAQNVGFLEGAWNAAKSAVDRYLEAAKGIGRTKTVDDELEAAEQRAQRIRDVLAGKALPSFGEFRTTAGFEDQLKKEDALIARLKESKALGEQVATAQAAQAARNEAQLAWDRMREQNMTKQARLAKELATANAIADKLGLSASDRESELAAIRAKYEDKGAASAANQERKASLTARVNEIQEALRAETDAYKNAESILEATRSAGLAGLQEYYDAKQAFVRLDAEAQVRALEAQNRALAADKTRGAEGIRNQSEIKKNESEIARIRAEATTKGIVLSTQSAAARASETRALIDARIAAQQYLDTLTLQGERELENIRLSDRARERAAGRQQIDDRYTQQRQELQATRTALELEGKFTEEARTQYNARLAIIDEFNDKALRSFERTFDQRIALEANASIGAQRAWENYRDNAANVMRQTEDLYSRTFQGLEDTLVTFVTTGKLSFKSLADSIITEIVRIQIRAAASKIFGGSGVTDFLGNLASGLFGGSTGAGSMGTDYSLPTTGIKFGPRAAGGPVERGGLYRVNELGPELLNLAGKQYLMMGNQSGNITPHDQSMQQLRGGMSQAMAAQVVKVSLPAINLINNTGTAATATAQQRTDGGIDVILEALQNQVADGIAGGSGPVGKAIEGRYGLRPTFSA
ncbi:MAG: phage tail tape measure protein [Aquincola tertiaricarbonis]